MGCWLFYSILLIYLFLLLLLLLLLLRSMAANLPVDGAVIAAQSATTGATPSRRLFVSIWFPF